MEEKCYIVKSNEEVFDAELKFLNKEIEILQALKKNAELASDINKVNEYENQINEILVPYEYIKSVKLKKSR